MTLHGWHGARGGRLASPDSHPVYFFINRIITITLGFLEQLGVFQRCSFVEDEFWFYQQRPRMCCDEQPQLSACSLAPGSPACPPVGLDGAS